MTTLLILALLSGDGGGWNDRGCGFFGGRLTADLTLSDDLKLCWGDSTCDFWMTFNSVSTQWEFWSTDVGAGADGLLMICDVGDNDCVFPGLLSTTGGLAINADNAKLTLGAGESADFELYFDGTDIQAGGSGDFVFNLSPVAGVLVIDPDSGLVPILDMSVTGGPAQGTAEGYVFQVAGSNHTQIYCESDGVTGIEDCHLIQSYSPVMTPSSDQALAGDANFDCDEGINRIVGSGGAVTLSASPSVNDGDIDGQICRVQGTSDANTVTINDNTNVQLAGGAAFTLGKGDILILWWDAGDGDWYEESRSDN